MTIARFIITLTLFLVLFSTAISQTPCNTPGQNPTSAFPVCGTGTFVQSSVNLCGGRKVPNPVCGNTLLDDRNPYYYKFTCYEAGTLGFLITPNDNNSDYDWQLFDITGKDPNTIFTDVTLSVSSNWSGYTGQTGTNATATGQFECAGNVPNFSRRPALVKGRDYLLLISHFSNNQAGYKLEFNGGTAVITDTAKPLMHELQIACTGTDFYLKMNKPIKCSSIAADGSDWEFFNGNVPIAKTVGVGCTTGFATDSLIITAATAVPVGTFALRAKKGSDTNTLLDLCDAALAEGQTLVVNRLPPFPTPIDSIKSVRCKPTELELVMGQAILCTSIAADGSDFTIAGPAQVNIAGATQVNCSNNLIKTIRLQLSRPITLGGLYTVTVKQGSDGNTLLNACNISTEVGNSASFTAYDSVLAKIDVLVNSSCEADTITFSNPVANGINRWRWTESSTNQTGTAPMFLRIFTERGDVNVNLEVTNGVCTDSGKAVVNLSGLRVKAEFEYPAFACPGDTIFFTNKSTGPVAAWRWNFGNGNTSTLQNPPAQFYTTALPIATLPVWLEVSHTNGCRDTVLHEIKVPNNCYIAVPNAFTPNGDGLNDYLYPLNAWKATDLVFRLYNRYGQLVWETTQWTRKWDGNTGGNKAPSGSYAWMLQYTDSETGKKVVQKGTTLLIR
jgi:gliding motility-associated-like protein